MTELNTGRSDYEERRRQWLEAVAASRDSRPRDASLYRNTVRELLQRLIMPGARVLDIAAGTGDLLASVAPRYGVGIEQSQLLCQAARSRHPDLHFINAAAENVELNESFDYVIASDVIPDCFDVESFLAGLRNVCAPETRVILTHCSQVWRPLLKLCRKVGLAKPRFGTTWFSPADMRSAFRSAGFEVIRETTETLLPFKVPLVSAAANRIIARLPLFRGLCLHHVYVARIEPQRMTPPPRVSVIIPARNEAGNVERILREIPQMGAETEIIFVEGNSTDNTWEVLQNAVAAKNDPLIRLLKQTGRGKADAVRTGFAASTGDILMILDADLTVPAEMLPRFYQAIVSGKAEFANGTRLVYQMDDKAMQFLNLIANHCIAWAFTFVLGQPVRDTLCGTKALPKKAYNNIVANREYFGDFDPFGDFDLLFGAARLNLRIMDIPIRYRERVYGETNINRFRHGWLLFRMLGVAALKLKFA